MEAASFLVKTVMVDVGVS